MTQNEFTKKAVKTYLDHNAVFLTEAQLPREVRCFFCKSSSRDVSLYLNHDAIGEALIVCMKCHGYYLQSSQKTATLAR